MSFQTSPYEAEQAAATANGKSAPPPASVVIQLQDHKASGGGPRASRELSWLRLSDDPESSYAEFKVYVRLRYPSLIQRQIAGSSLDVMIEGLKKVVFEHNNWLDPESTDDPPPVLPQPNEPCPIQTKLDKAIHDEQATLDTELSKVKNDLVRATLRTEFEAKVGKLRDDASAEREALGRACCFWDRIDQYEIVLIARRINDTRGKGFDLMLGTQPS